MVPIDEEDIRRIQRIHEDKEDHDLLVEIRTWQEVFRKALDDHEIRIRSLRTMIYTLSFLMVAGGGGITTKLAGLW